MEISKEFSRKFISTIKKGTSRGRSSSPINPSKIDKIIDEWYDSNERLRCTCSKNEFNKYINLNFNALEGIFGNQYAIQSGGGPKVMLLLNLFALLIFITSMIYNQTQREEVKREINKNIDTINDAIIQFDTTLNITHQSNLSLPLVNSSDITNSSNFNTTLTNYMKRSMEKFLRTAEAGIYKECEKTPTFFDSIPNFEKLVYQYIPLPSKIVHTLKVANVQKERKHQKEKYDEEHECYMLAFQQLEQNKTAEMNQLFTTITHRLIDADKGMKDEIKINLYNNLMMSIAFAVLAARFYFYKRGIPPTSPGEVMAIMEQNIGAVMPAAAPLQIEGPRHEERIDISPPNSNDERRKERVRRGRSLAESPEPAPIRSASRLERRPKQTQKFLWNMDPANPLNQGGARRRRQTHKRKHRKTKRSISKSKRKTRKHK